MRQRVAKEIDSILFDVTNPVWYFINAQPARQRGREKLMKKDLLEDHRYFINNRETLVSKYNGQYITIADCAIIGNYATESEALAETIKTHKLGTFIVKKCVPQADETPIVFHSRVSFA